MNQPKILQEALDAAREVQADPHGLGTAYRAGYEHGKQDALAEFPMNIILLLGMVTTFIGGLYLVGEFPAYMAQ